MVLTLGTRWILARGALIALAALPAALATRQALESGPGAAPWFTDVDGRLPLIHVARLLAELPIVAPMLLVAAAIAVVGNQLLTAGALSTFLRTGGDPAPAGVLRSSGRDGLAHLGPFLRILGLGVLVSAVGAALTGKAMTAIGHIGERQAWTAATLGLMLPALRALLLTIVMAKVGAWVLACRALTVADGRRRVRRTAILALRACWRAPVGWVLRFAVVTIAVTVGSGGLLWAWGQAAPFGARLVLWLALWTLVVLVQAAVWLWFVHGAAVLVEDERFADLRCVPDAPFGLVARFRRRS